MAELTILLVVDDVTTCKRFVEYIDSREDIVLVNATNSSSQALSDIDYYRPHAVILDLELHCGSGFDVLSAIDRMNDKPYVVITTNNSSGTTYESVRTMGADFIMYKHQENYTEESVIDLLYSMRHVIQGKRMQQNQMEAGTSECRNKCIIRSINNELNIVGINPKAVGYMYLIDAINIIIDENINNVCNIVARKYNKSEESVRRAMQTAINRAWTKTDIEVLLDNYKARITSESGSPTIMEFIYYYANKVKNMV